MQEAGGGLEREQSMETTAEDRMQEQTIFASPRHPLLCSSAVRSPHSRIYLLCSAPVSPLGRLSSLLCGRLFYPFCIILLFLSAPPLLFRPRLRSHPLQIPQYIGSGRISFYSHADSVNHYAIFVCVCVCCFGIHHQERLIQRTHNRTQLCLCIGIACPVTYDNLIH